MSLLLLRADNNGEGGTLSLTALATRALGRRTTLVFLLGLIGAAMFLGDSMITPAISVLSAVEGLNLATPAFEHFVVPLTIVILTLLFMVQRRGTARVASFFGPVMVTWFVVLADCGPVAYQRRPRRASRHQSVLCDLVCCGPRHDRPGDARCRVPGGDRRRSALCRPRPFWPQADPDGLVRTGVARRWSSTISDKARWCSPTPPPSRTRSFGWFPKSFCCR